MKVEFENSIGYRRIIGECETYKEAVKIIQNFLNNHNYKPYYWQWTMGEEEWTLDVGSHTEFFFLSELPKDFINQFNNN